MKRILLFAAVVMHGSLIIAQQQLENPGFENWENVGSATEEPTQWSSIKTSDNSSLNAFAPKVLFQSTDAHTGSYSVRLENVTSLNIVATGTVTNGRAHAELPASKGYVFTDASDSNWNTPFTDRPDSIVGWYKYAPASGDRAKVEAIIHSSAAKNPENGTAGNFIGRARFVTSATASSWTRFSVPFAYFNGNASSHILLVLTSGDSTIAKEGSVAFYDDISLVYNPVSVSEINPSKILTFQNASNICVQLPIIETKFVTANVYDLQGREVSRKDNLNSGINYLDLPKNEGVYLVSLNFDGKVITKKIVITNY